MKKTIGIFALLLLAFCLQSCSDKEKEVRTPTEVSTETLDFPTSESSILELKVTCGKEWEIASNKNWCYVVDAQEIYQPCKDKVISVKVEPNIDNKGREATLTITEVGGATKTVAVTQSASSVAVPEFKSFKFGTVLNPGKIPNDLTCQISGNTVSFRTPFVMEDKELIPDFTIEGEKVYMGSEEIISGVTKIDFAGPVKLTVENKAGSTREYTIKLISFNGLPVVYLNTKSGSPIVSKDDYVDAAIKIVDNNGLRQSSIFESDVPVKGRGNSTWDVGMSTGKKPYRLKFDKKQSLLGEPADKSWVLLANYMDDDIGMRNATAYSFGHLSCMPYTPTVHFVDLFVNGQYAGLYTLCEHTKISKDRVNVTDNGFLIEAEQRDDPALTGDLYFTAITTGPDVQVRFCVKDPDMDEGSEPYNAMKEYVTNAQNSIYAENFKDTNHGYAKYLNVDTYVDWYVISEITKTNDADLYTSCYMNKAPDSKLNMGPMWDYDICINNSRWNNTDPYVYHNKHSRWFNRLLQDPAFRQKVKARISYFKSNLPAIQAKMDENAEYIKLAIVADNKIYRTMLSSGNDLQVEATFMKHVSSMKSWLTTRLNWLDQASFED